MAMISPYKDYELTRSFFKLQQMYYETKREKESLETDIKWKDERLKDIADRMRQILSEDDEYEILKNNYLTYENNKSVVSFVENMLGTRDVEKVMTLITKTLTHLDSSYTKEYWQKELDSGRFGVVEEIEETKEKLLVETSEKEEKADDIPSILTKEGIAAFLEREELVPGKNLKSFEVDYDLDGKVRMLHIEMLERGV